MTGKRIRTYLMSGVLAFPPVLAVGYFFSSVTPQPENVPAVVGANDPEVDLVPQRGAQANRQVQLAARQR